MRTGLDISIRKKRELRKMLKNGVEVRVIYGSNFESGAEGLYILCYMYRHRKDWNIVTHIAYPGEYTFFRVKDKKRKYSAPKYTARYISTGIYILYERKNLVNKTLEG